MPMRAPYYVNNTIASAEPWTADSSVVTADSTIYTADGGVMSQDPGLISGIPLCVANTISVQQPATLQSEYSGQTVTATRDFAFLWNGALVNFWANETTVCDAGLLAALQAQSMPVTTP